MTNGVDLPRLSADLAIPGIADVHTHFMPDAVMQKVWHVFDMAERTYGVPWPIEYRLPDEGRVALLRGWGVRAFTALGYAHRPGMASWLNEWAAGFSAENPDCVRSATFFPEPGVAEYVAQAITDGARVFKVHVQVSGIDVLDRSLRPVWTDLQDSKTPVVIHCGSGPIPGVFTGPGPVTELLREFPRLELIIAHAGAPEYAEFLDLVEAYPGVHLDTAMAFTAFLEERAPFPLAVRPRLRDAGLRGDVLFGSDFPNLPYPYSEAVDALVRLGFGEDWLRAVLWGGSARLFRLADS